MDSTLDCGTRGKTKGCGSLSTKGLSEAGLVIAALLSSSEQSNRIYYPWLSSDLHQQYCEKVAPENSYSLTHLWSPVSYQLHSPKKKKPLQTILKWFPRMVILVMAEGKAKISRAELSNRTFGV